MLQIHYTDSCSYVFFLFRPMTANPFHALGGVKKILGDLFSSCLELPSLEDIRPSVTDGVSSKYKPAQNDSIAKILGRKKPNSEPSSPTARKKWERKVEQKKNTSTLLTSSSNRFVVGVQHCNYFCVVFYVTRKCPRKIQQLKKKKKNK